MRRVSSLPWMLGSRLALRLAFGVLVTFSTANASTTADSKGNTRTRPGGQLDAKFLVMEQDTVSSPLPEGDTTFIIFLARSSTLDRFTFINENKPARGQFRIAVANEKLSADSNKWTSVDGAISFRSKRLFNVSMLGVDARYVRLTFHVEHEEGGAALNPSETIALN